MKKLNIILTAAIAILTSCSSMIKPTLTTKYDSYKEMYEEKPLTVLIMPPINRSTYVDAKEYFHSTLNTPIVNAGYYVIPPFLSMEILKKESAYDSELFLYTPLKKFEEVFGADMVVFTIIHSWDKSSLDALVVVDVEYIFKSTKTNEIVFTRRGQINYDASVSSGAKGILGFVADLTISALNTSTIKYINVARSCNSYVFKDLPAGKYSPNYDIDRTSPSGLKEFSVTLNSKEED
ncbi:MAG: hypothetical protein CVU08_10055 [Bacteroidetes bacterium HGW-Bacteroidetes-3]|jgi:hypothetical protein|nr:MAG: hypothetical protein CVU08_10055 [Bacteroidetes bacterium HGW-Bacteroidetes-3]